MTPEERANIIITGANSWGLGIPEVSLKVLRSVIVVSINEAIKAEREACAETIEHHGSSGDMVTEKKVLAQAIRARGKTE